MDNRYKLIIYNRNIYKEIEITADKTRVKVGTGLDCDFRLHKEMFFEPVELDFVKNQSSWSVYCADNLYITVGDIRKLATKNLTHGEIFHVRYQDTDNEVFAVEFLIDFGSENRKYDKQIDLSGINKFSIGSDSGNNIILRSDYVRDDALLFTKKGSSLRLNIKRAQYGVYHNGSRVESGSEIKNSDFFSLADFFFYYKDNVLYTENRDGLVVNGLNYTDMPDMNTYPKFNRSTRIKTVINEEDIEILDPPTKPQKPKNNLLMRLLPSMGMLITAGIMASMGGRMIRMSAISGSMAILTTILGMREGNKEYKENSEKRVTTYNRYIDNKKEEIEKYRSEEKENLNDVYVSVEKSRERLELFTSELFDRKPEDEDFLEVYLGTGAVEARRKINYKKQEKLEIEDELQLIPQQIYEDYKYIKESPIVCNFRDANAIGVVGHTRNRFEIMKNIVMDIMIRQYYSDVKMAFIAEKHNKDKILWVRMLPQIYNDALQGRMMVCDDESKNAIYEFLYKELTQRENSKQKNTHLVLFFFDEYGFKNHPISRFVEKAKDLNVTFVFFGDQIADVHQGCSYIISIENEKKATLIDTADRNNSTEFTYTNIEDEKVEELVRILAPVYTEEISLEGTLTKNISLFELLNIISVDDIDLGTRWAQSQVYKSMAAPLGVTKSSVINLDLHDKFHGPHGLVAGTTGSGKSEILQTYILSMATLYHPYEVGFVIIDFKGGGMVNQFKSLPHLMGAITNIDGKEINRSLKSIKAELQKRQRYFADADVNHIDKYIRKYKAGEVKEPLPHLIIVVDEFAELKAEQPEFMKELISAARIGRSLGVHLILATQKPSGQVNEQIWSNSRFKLCLKVQSQEDSNEVIKSPLAAEIKEPGRAYLQVGNNEIFELFQSAYSGAPEKVDDSNKKEFSIYSINESGKRVPVYVQKKDSKSTGGNQLDAIVNHVASYCEESDIRKLPDICLPPLEKVINFPDNHKKYSTESMPLGVYDAPDLQYQGFANFNLQDTNTLIIGSSSTGKTNLLQNIIRFSASKYSPEEVVFYIMDFGAMYLKNYEKLNHVGGVVTIAEDEKLKNLFKLLSGEVTSRKNRFMESGLSSYSAYVEAGYKDLPLIFVMIDNFSAFKEIYSDAFEDQLLYLTREGNSCGISIIMTNSTTSGIGYKYMSNIGNRIAFTSNDTNEYSNLFTHCRMQPDNTPGRALCEIDKEIYEFQSFLAFEGEKEIERSAAVKQFVAHINEMYAGKIARRIPSVPDKLTAAYLETVADGRISEYRYPVAMDYAEVEAVYLDFRQLNEFCIIGRDNARRLKAVDGILGAMHRSIFDCPVKMYIIDSIDRPLKNKAELPYVEKYTVDSSYISTVLDDIMPELERRQRMIMDGEVDAVKKMPHIMVVINNRDTAEFICSNKKLLEMYNQINKKLKATGVSFLFTDVEDVNVGYNAPEILKRFKDTKKALVTSSLAEFKFCDISSAAVRNNKTAKPEDCFMLNGQEVTRIKMVEV